MSETEKKHVRLHHRGRLHQVPIYLGKQMRSFLYVSDWKVLPMAAVIAGLLAMVIRKYLFITMEGTLLSAFALTCVAIWNGCFNSIQVVCRERGIIKREHRGGMHITSYVFSSMIYQALLCLAQSVITMVICQVVGVNFPEEGFMTPWLIVDIGITMFLITYAADMMSLFISSIAHNTTTAMTVMPFVLIFQLIFSGSIIPLPTWAKDFSKLTISNYGLTAIAAQADYNNMPMNTGWTTLIKMENTVVEGDVPVSKVMDLAADDNGLLKGVRENDYVVMSPEIAKKMIYYVEKQINAWLGIPEEPATEAAPAEAAPAEAPAAEAAPAEAQAAEAAPAEAQAAEAAPAEAQAAEAAPAEAPAAVTAPAEEKADGIITVKGREVIDFLLGLEPVKDLSGESIHYSFRVGDVIDAVGRTQLETYIKNASAKAMYDEAYARTLNNVMDNWAMLVGFALLFALLSTIALEFIDKDKR